MSESDRDRLRRLNQEAQRQRRKANDDALAARLQREADEQAAQAQRDAKMDKAFENDLADLLGADDFGQVEDAMREALKSDDSELKDIASQYQSAMRRGKKTKAKKIVKSNKAKVKKHVKESKKGCLSALVVGVGTGVTLLGAAVWGASEIVSALAK